MREETLLTMLNRLIDACKNEQAHVYDDAGDTRTNRLYGNITAFQTVRDEIIDDVIRNVEVSELLDFIKESGNAAAILEWVAANLVTEDILNAIDDTCAIEDYLNAAGVKTDKGDSREPWYVP